MYPVTPKFQKIKKYPNISNYSTQVTESLILQRSLWCCFMVLSDYFIISYD